MVPYPIMTQTMMSSIVRNVSPLFLSRNPYMEYSQEQLSMQPIAITSCWLLHPNVMGKLASCIMQQLVKGMDLSLNNFLLLWSVRMIKLITWCLVFKIILNSFVLNPYHKPFTLWRDFNKIKQFYNLPKVSYYSITWEVSCWQ